MKFLKFSITSLILGLIMLIVPTSVFASSETDLDYMLSQDEINAILDRSNFSNIDNQRAATVEEFELIVNKSLEELEENPAKEVDLTKILEELNLTDIATQEDIPTDNVGIMSMALGAGNLGFQNFYRNKTNFEAQAHVQSTIPFTTIDQIGGNIKGWSLSPGASQWILMFSEPFNEANVKYGITKVSGLKSVAHFGNPAKMVIEAVIRDGKVIDTASKGIVSQVNGTFYYE